MRDGGRNLTRMLRSAIFLLHVPGCYILTGPTDSSARTMVSLILKTGSKMGSLVILVDKRAGIV